MLEMGLEGSTCTNVCMETYIDTCVILGKSFNLSRSRGPRFLPVFTVMFCNPPN